MTEELAPTRARALTVRQPWLEAIVAGHKLVENRAQGFPKGHRGPLLLHAGAALSRHGVLSRRVRAVIPPGTQLARGAVVGMAELTDVHPAAECCAPWGEQTYPPANPEDRPPGTVTHLVLERPTRLPHPIPARGALGLWRPDPDLQLEVAHALAALVTWDPAGATAVAERGDLDQLWHLLGDDG